MVSLGGYWYRLFFLLIILFLPFFLYFVVSFFYFHFFSVRDKKRAKTQKETLQSYYQKKGGKIELRSSNHDSSTVGIRSFNSSSHYEMNGVRGYRWKTKNRVAAKVIHTEAFDVVIASRLPVAHTVTVGSVDCIINSSCNNTRVAYTYRRR